MVLYMIPQREWHGQNPCTIRIKTKADPGRQRVGQDRLFLLDSVTRKAAVSPCARLTRLLRKFPDAGSRKRRYTGQRSGFGAGNLCNNRAKLHGVPSPGMS